MAEIEIPALIPMSELAGLLDLTTVLCKFSPIYSNIQKCRVSCDLRAFLTKWKISCVSCDYRIKTQNIV